MLALEGRGIGVVTLEVLLWGVPAVLAMRLVRTLPPDHRRSWIVIAAACAVIVLDKVVDLQMAMMTAGRALVRRLAPGMRRGGSDHLGRAALLAALLVVACVALWALVRADRHFGPAKATALAGLVGVMGFLGARLVPSLAGPLGTGGLGWVVELVCCALVWTGILAARARGET